MCAQVQPGQGVNLTSIGIRPSKCSKTEKEQRGEAGSCEFAAGQAEKREDRRAWGGGRSCGLQRECLEFTQLATEAAASQRMQYLKMRIWMEVCDQQQVLERSQNNGWLIKGKMTEAEVINLRR